MVGQKNIALWSHPRSMSTSVERYFRERGDCWCHHEPFMYFYYLEKHGKPYPGFDPEDNRPRDLHDIAEMVTSRLAGNTGHQHIFFKDMSYYITDHLTQLEDLMLATVPLFLIRDPRLSLASYSKLDPDFTREEGGLEAQWQHFERLKSWGIDPLVVDADAITSSPEDAMGRVCAYAGIPFIKEALSWQAEALPEDWQQTKAWHEGIINSTNFAPPDSRNPDEVFEAAAKNMPELQGYLDHHQPFYDQFKAHSI